MAVPVLNKLGMRALLSLNEPFSAMCGTINQKVAGKVIVLRLRYVQVRINEACLEPW